MKNKAQSTRRAMKRGNLFAIPDLVQGIEWKTITHATKYMRGYFRTIAYTIDDLITMLGPVRPWRIAIDPNTQERSYIK